MIKIQWLASIWCQKWSNNDEFAPIWCQKHQNNAVLRKWSNWTSKRAKILSYVEKTFKTTQNCKSNQITMNCIDLNSKTSKQSKTTEAIKLHELHRFDVKTIKTTQNYKSDQIGRQNGLKCWVTSQIFKTTPNYESDQNTMSCIDLMSKRSKQRKTPNAIKLPWICIDLTSKRSKMLSYVAKHSKQR